MIKDKHLPAMQGMFPSWITSCSEEGEPNTTVISQIWYVDKNHVALSFQFFNKTKKNGNSALLCDCVRAFVGGHAIRLAPRSDAANANARQLVQPIHLDFKKPDAFFTSWKNGLTGIWTLDSPNRSKHSNHYVSRASADAFNDVQGRGGNTYFF